jgi:hypothetical protein
LGGLWAFCGLFYGKLKKIGKTLRQLAIKAVTLQCANVRSAWKPHVATVQLHLASEKTAIGTQETPKSDV